MDGCDLTLARTTETRYSCEIRSQAWSHCHHQHHHEEPFLRKEGFSSSDYRKSSLHTVSWFCLSVILAFDEFDKIILILKHASNCWWFPWIELFVILHFIWPLYVNYFMISQACDVGKVMSWKNNGMSRFFAPRPEIKNNTCFCSRRLRRCFAWGTKNGLGQLDVDANEALECRLTEKMMDNKNSMLVNGRW